MTDAELFEKNRKGAVGMDTKKAVLKGVLTMVVVALAGFLLFNGIGRHPYQPDELEGVFRKEAAARSVSGEGEVISETYGNSITFSRDISDYETACHVILSLAETIGARLRTDHVLCNSVCVELKDWQFRIQSHQASLPFSTDSTSIIYEKACSLLKEFWDMTPVRLIGVRTGKISDCDYVQMSLFDNERTEKLKNLEKAVDSIRGRFGTDSIKRAAFLKKDSIVDHASGKHKHLNSQTNDSNHGS